MRRALITIAACAVTLGGASAQEVYVDDADVYDDDTYVEAPAVVEEEPVIVEEGPAAEGVIVGPRVYGWSEIRPANCGTFKYWDGETCADARFDPPPTD
jgi:hypothetical protein